MTDFRKIYNLDLLNFVSEFVTDDRKIVLQEKLSLRIKNIRFVSERLLDMQNIDAIMRTCDILGWQHLDIVPYEGNLKAARSVSRGAHQWISIRQFDTIADNIEALKSQKILVFAADSNVTNAYNLSNLPIDQPLAIILGNEHNGISAETRKLVDGFVQIPSYGFTESFNVSVAAAIIGYTLNQRIRNQHHAVLLTEEEKENLYYQWIWHSVKRPDILYHEFQKSYIK